jgi:hypothetical protein
MIDNDRAQATAQYYCHRRNAAFSNGANSQQAPLRR